MVLLILFSFLKINFILTVFVFCLHVCLGIACMSGAHDVQERSSDTLVLSLQMAVRCHLGVRKPTHVLWKINKGS